MRSIEGELYFYLGLLDSTALWGAIAFLACVFGLGVEVPTIFDSAVDPVGFRGLLYAAMGWSVVAYPVLMAFHLTRVKVGHRKYQDPELRRRLKQPLVVSAATFLWADFTNPFRGLRAFGFVRGQLRDDRSQYHGHPQRWFFLDLAEVVAHSIWTVAFWAVVGAGALYLLVN